ncbi:MAG: DNA-3-methyladenine glycosylase I [Pseudomonadales bacterium]|jgi:DNA-3-methyladenine glycosylase I|nr:DNA-3-methyladenine glycosylase I [Pseudomonadales bacterium]
MPELEACPWCGADPLYRAYHDEEWGVPCRDEHRLFEFLVLEGMQAGLAWITILRKRPAFRAAFADFDAAHVARFDEGDRARLLSDAGIVRNRAKIDAAITAARIVLDLREHGDGLTGRLWSHVDGEAIQHRYRRLEDVPASDAVAERMSRDLRSLGMKFVGPTICYALMQAAGLVNDHLIDCPRHTVCAALARSGD